MDKTSYQHKLVAFIRKFDVKHRIIIKLNTHVIVLKRILNLSCVS